MRKILINYSTPDMMEHQKINTDTGLKFGFDECYEYGPNDIDKDFYNENKSILDEKKGAGYFLWKPYVILKKLNELDYGDILYYSDSRINFIDDVSPLLNLCELEDIVIFSNKFYGVNKNWCKRDAFYYMDCDSEEYHNGEHLQASFIILKKSNKSLKFAEEFLNYSKDRRIITEDEDVCGLEVLDGFNENRYDQTVLSLLAMKWGIKPHRDPSQIGLYNKNLFDDKYGQIVVHHRGRQSIMRDSNINLLMKKYRMGNLQDDQEGRNRLFGLKKLIEDNLNQDSVVCEIGSYEGKSSELFALSCNKIYCIDPWVDVWTPDDMEKDINILNAETSFDEMIENYNNIIKIKNISSVVYKEFDDEFFDFVYIDAMHDYNSVKNDINYWIDKVKNDGYIGGHDCIIGGEVYNAIIDYFKIEPKIYEDTSWIIKKDLIKDRNFKSQNGQDEYILSLLNNKENGFFVELGACDGVLFSNTYYFEKKLNWTGILIEPNPLYWEDLNKNRNCGLSNKLCDDVSGKEVDFLLAEAMGGIINDNPGYWVNYHMDKDKLKLKTFTLSEILDEFKAPKVMDFLSLDVEGSEYNILSTFPFDKYEFNYICVEHNNYWSQDDNKMKIQNILIKNGYNIIKETDLDDYYEKIEKT